MVALLFELVRHAGESGVGLAAEGGHGADRRDRDEDGDERILDRGCAGFVPRESEEQGHEVHSLHSFSAALVRAGKRAMLKRALIALQPLKDEARPGVVEPSGLQEIGTVTNRSYL